MDGISSVVLTDIAQRSSTLQLLRGAMRTGPEIDVADPLAAGRAALSRGEWEQALAYFEAASERSHSAEAIEALAMSA